ncbi:hypothetical protein CF15_00255 [Pyrodictium occultum]|uniref:DUF763 domain-containing protein n=1 Tax=Pyrodictium occultum TaxID=2309 RepID=A0A0V8RTD8_PYROC|nr:DUF763 domain-containing protein [Pyrodictium occultum]KSW11340.1 hypothetical protein CF15_00255 [Pyrodictium occultum]
MYGVAELPLHGGHVPAWLARYMKRLAHAILAAVVELHGPDRAVKWFADPFWFQAFNNAIGMDWDSSGSTTVTIGIVKQVAREDPSLGIAVAGGKGEKAREAPLEIEEAAERLNLSSQALEELKLASRLSAKTDSVLLQDGYQLYHHAVIVSATGRWTVVQQGMNTEARMARRYHWSRPLPPVPTLEPHNAIASGRRESFVVDLTSRMSIEARNTIVDLAREGPRRVLDQIRQAYALVRGVAPLTAFQGSRPRISLEELRRYARYYRPQSRPPRHIERVLNKVYEASPRSIEELVMIEGVGPATLRSLALVAEIVYGVPVSHRDPANSPIDPFRYAYVAGGKDGVPYPFRRDHAEKVIEFLEKVVEEARIDEKARRRVLERIRRLASLLPR